MDPRESSSDPTNSPSAAPRERGLTPASSLMTVKIRRRTLTQDKLSQNKPQPPVPQTIRPEPPPAPAVAHPASDPGRRMPSIAPPPIAPPAVPTHAAPTNKPLDDAPLTGSGPTNAGLTNAGEPPSPAPTPPAPTVRPPITAPRMTHHARTGSVVGKPALAIPAIKPPAPKPPSVHQADTPPPLDVAQQSAEPSSQPTRPEGIVSYWLRLRGNRRFPSKADLDHVRIIADWPNSILMRCRVGSKALEPEKVFSSPDKGQADTSSVDSQAAMELSPLMLQWLLGLAGDAAKDRRPMQDTEAFPSRNQSIQYGAFALPFSDDQNQIDHVLCHVYRVS